MTPAYRFLILQALALHMSGCPICHAVSRDHFVGRRNSFTPRLN